MARTIDVTTKPAPMPSIGELEVARRLYLEHEPRDLFYKVASELIDMARRRATTVTVVEALALLLQTWNASWYRFRGRFNETGFTQLEELLGAHAVELESCRERSILTMALEDVAPLGNLFKDFAATLGPVGAAKCLHLLAPRWFPLWDRPISKAYGLNLDKDAAASYLTFMGIVKRQSAALVAAGMAAPDLLKRIDEWNYVEFTLKPDRHTACPCRGSVPAPPA